MLTSLSDFEHRVGINKGLLFPSSTEAPPGNQQERFSFPMQFTLDRNYVFTLSSLRNVLSTTLRDFTTLIILVTRIYDVFTLSSLRNFGKRLALQIIQFISFIVLGMYISSFFHSTDLSSFTREKAMAKETIFWDGPTQIVIRDNE